MEYVAVRQQEKRKTTEEFDEGSEGGHAEDCCDRGGC